MTWDARLEVIFQEKYHDGKVRVSVIHVQKTISHLGLVARRDSFCDSYAVNMSTVNRFCQSLTSFYVKEPRIVLGNKNPEDLNAQMREKGDVSEAVH